VPHSGWAWFRLATAPMNRCAMGQCSREPFARSSASPAQGPGSARVWQAASRSQIADRPHPGAGRMSVASQQLLAHARPPQSAYPASTICGYSPAAVHQQRKAARIPPPTQNGGSRDRAHVPLIQWAPAPGSGRHPDSEGVRSRSGGRRLREADSHQLPGPGTPLPAPVGADLMAPAGCSAPRSKQIRPLPQQCARPVQASAGRSKTAHH